ncbi:hypothetical protein Pelo_19841 [Pelomyxa schiedti]|nr:hypothetical protein Pelo_19841 [Pelomyxa schiedti]
MQHKVEKQVLSQLDLPSPPKIAIQAEQVQALFSQVPQPNPVQTYFSQDSEVLSEFIPSEYLSKVATLATLDKNLVDAERLTQIPRRTLSHWWEKFHLQGLTTPSKPTEPNTKKRHVNIDTLREVEPAPLVEATKTWLLDHAPVQSGVLKAF